MNQAPSSVALSTDIKKSASQSPLIKIIRTFAAPVERLWSAWSEPELVKQWWGPVGYSCPEAKIDFRIGGKCILAMKGPDNEVLWSVGIYEQLVPFKKMISTDNFSDENGKIISARDAGMPAEWKTSWNGSAYTTIDFEATDRNETKMTFNHEGLPKEMYDECTEGWNGSFDKLQKLVERN